MTSPAQSNMERSRKESPPLSSDSEEMIDLNKVVAENQKKAAMLEDDDSRTTLNGSDDLAGDLLGNDNVMTINLDNEDSYDCVGYPERPAQDLLSPENKKKYGLSSILSSTETIPEKKMAATKPPKKAVRRSNNKENVVPTTTQPKNWPHMRALVSENIILIILNAVDECGCTSELAASNGDNPKGNKWSRFYDPCYGGISDVNDTNVRGLLGNRWRVLPNPTKLKQKVQDIWSYVKKEKDTGKIPLDVVGIAERQMNEYEELKAKDREESAKAKDKEDRLQKQMEVYSKSVGGIPPGAKGDTGAGRREHSTNLVQNEPSLYSYVNNTTAVTTPANRNTKARVATSSKSSSTNSSTKPPAAITVNNEAMCQVSSFTNKFEKMFDRHFGSDSITTHPNNEEDGREKKRRRLLDAKKNHMETIQFLKGMNDEVSKNTYNKALNDFRAICEQINKHDKQDGVLDSNGL